MNLITLSLLPFYLFITALQEVYDKQKVLYLYPYLPFFFQVINLPARIDPVRTSAVVSLHGRLLVRMPFAK